jgi:hypothetical protein
VDQANNGRRELEVLRAYGAQRELARREQDRVPPPDADLLDHNRWIGELRGRRRQVVPAHSPFTQVTPEEEFLTTRDEALDEDLRQAEAVATAERLRRKRGLIEYLRRTEPGISLVTHHSAVMGWNDFQVDAMWPLATGSAEVTPAAPGLDELRQREYDLYVAAYRQAPPDPRARLKLAPPAPTRPEQFAAIDELHRVQRQIAELERVQSATAPLASAPTEVQPREPEPERRRRRGKFPPGEFAGKLREVLDARALADAEISQELAADDLDCDAKTLREYLNGHDGAEPRLEWETEVASARVRAIRRLAGNGK